MNLRYKKISKSYSSVDLTPEQIYDISMGKSKGGIPGYVCPRKYFDYHLVLWLRRRENILK